MDIGLSGASMAKDTRSRIIELFEAIRATPGAEYDDGHFMDYLLPEPGGNDVVRNSFTGLRRFNSFIEQMQIEFGVCYSLRDLEANYSLDKFVRRTEELLARPAGSMRSLQNQKKAGAGLGPMLLLNLVLLIVGYVVRDIWWALGIVVLAATIANTWFLRFASKRRAYLGKLEEIIARQLA